MRQAVGPGVMRQRRVDQPATDKRHHAVSHPDIGFARRERPIEHDGPDHRIYDRTGGGSHRPGADEDPIANVTMVMCGRRKRSCGAGGANPDTHRGQSWVAAM